MNKNSGVLRLVESALLLAVGAALSLIKLVELPYGGSITACSALPILLIAYRHGTVWGLFSGFAYALLQLLLGLNTLSYCSTALSAAMVILLDYLLAFTVLGLGGIFRRGRSQGGALVLGAVFTGGARYVFHVIAGCTVWAGLSIPTEAALVYSLAYNATYMLPETLVTVLGAWYFSQAVDVREERLTRAAGPDGRRRLPSLLAAGALTAAGIADVALVFARLQNGETGDFDITGLAQVPWLTVGVITAAGAAISAGLWWLARRGKTAE